MNNKIWSLVFVMVILAFFSLACKSPETPQPPQPYPPTYYTISIKYIRSEIAYPADKDKMVGVSLIGRTDSNANLTKVDDYHFEGQFQDPIADNENDSGLYSMYGIDQARAPVGDDSAGVVGDTFILKVQETGFEKQLLNVQQNTLQVNPYKGPNAKMACFRLKRDGTIVDQ